MLEVEPLLAPIDEANPSGPDLEYDPEWQELERLAQGKPEQQFGDTIIAAEEPDWREISKRAEALLARSKDVRSSVLLARAQAHLNQFSGVAAGLQFIHQMMDRFWDSVHPQLDASDGDDPTMRLNALSALADPGGLLRDTRNSRLFQSRAHGELTVRQVEVSAGKLTARADETVPTMPQIEQQLTAVIADDTELPSRVSATLASARTLAKLLDDKVGSDRSPDLKPLIATLLVLDQVVGRVVAAAQGVSVGGAGMDANAADGGGASGAAGGPAINAATGAIRSRQDAILLLDKISEFLQRTEPTNPVPLLLHRAKRLMTMNFVELMSEIAPDGLAQARIVIGSTEEPAE